MRWLRVTVALAALVMVAKVASARVPAFVRQTGLTCNQCHMSWSNAPDFTFTGLKFRANGYRTPWVAEKVEAGEEGAVNGQRLVLTLGSMLSWHSRSIIVAQSKSASDPSLAEPTAGSPFTSPISTVAMHYSGPIGEHVGFWNEFYLYGGNLTPVQGVGGSGSRNGYIGLSHYALVFTTNIGGNIYGFEPFDLTPAAGTHSLVGVTGNNVPNNQSRSPGLTGSGAPYSRQSIYAFMQDRVVLKLGIEPGEDNLDYKKLNYFAEFAVLPFNTDAGWGCVCFAYKAGNDMVPGISTLRPSNDGVRTLVPADAVVGVSATRANGQPLTSLNTGDANRMLVSIAYGFTDKGPHSFIAQVGLSRENENYNDGSNLRMRAVGFEGRYYYNRTYGVIFGLAKHLTWNYTAADGVVHKIPDDVQPLLRLVYKVAMNTAFYWEYNTQQTNALDQNYRNGYTWNLNIQWLW